MGFGESSMGRYIDGADRTQSVLFPERLDDWVEQDNPVRVVDAFVDALDLSSWGFDRAQAAETGRPGYRPRHTAQDLRLRLFESHSIQPPARAGSPAQRRTDLADRRLPPDFKTIADFRRDNGPAITSARRIRSDLSRPELFRGEHGPSTAASSRRSTPATRTSPRTSWRARQRATGRESVAHYLAELDRADRQPTLNPPRSGWEHLKQKLATVRAAGAQTGPEGSKSSSRQPLVRRSP